MLKSVIFDMDGVLVNSEPVHYRAYVEALSRWGKKLTYDEYKKYIGTTNAVIIDGLIETFGLPVGRDDFNELMKGYKAALYERDGYPGVAGIPELLKSLKEAGYRLAVASSSEMVIFKLHFEQGQEAVNKMNGCIEKLRTAGDDEHADKLRAALTALLQASLDALGG